MQFIQTNAATRNLPHAREMKLNQKKVRIVLARMECNLAQRNWGIVLAFRVRLLWPPQPQPFPEVSEVNEGSWQVIKQEASAKAPERKLLSVTDTLAACSEFCYSSVEMNS